MNCKAASSEEERKQRTEEREKHEAMKRKMTMEIIGNDNNMSKKKKKRRSHKFCFDWDDIEDTSSTQAADIHNHVAGPLFGRGFIAGTDRHTQKQRDGENRYLRSETRHWSEKQIEEMGEQDWRSFLAEHEISCKLQDGSTICAKGVKLMRAWHESGLDVELLEAVEPAGYVQPTPIQMAAIPLGLQQRDVIGVARTGSGKTAAFVLPMLAHIAGNYNRTVLDQGKGPYALVVAPTQLAALEIEAETLKLAECMRPPMRVVSVMEEDANKLGKGCDVLIAVPGALLHCLERRCINLNECNYVVLDKADQMMDMGLESQIAAVLDVMPSTNLKPINFQDYLADQAELGRRHTKKVMYRTTSMFSTTMIPQLERLASKYLRDPVMVTVGVMTGKTPANIQHHVAVLKESDKLQQLKKHLAKINDDERIIVFCNKMDTINIVARELDKLGFRARSLDCRQIGDSLEGFRYLRFKVLVVTDYQLGFLNQSVDMPDVGHVVSYDMPVSIKIYTDRIGRIERAGVVMTFLTMQDAGVFGHLREMLQNSGSPVPPELAVR